MAWLEHQGSEPGDKIQGLEINMRGAVAIRGFQLIAHLDLRVVDMTLPKKIWRCDHLNSQR